MRHALLIYILCCGSACGGSDDGGGGMTPATEPTSEVEPAPPVPEPEPEPEPTTAEKCAAEEQAKWLPESDIYLGMPRAELAELRDLESDGAFGIYTAVHYGTNGHNLTSAVYSQGDGEDVAASRAALAELLGPPEVSTWEYEIWRKDVSDTLQVRITHSAFHSTHYYLLNSEGDTGVDCAD